MISTLLHVGFALLLALGLVALASAVGMLAGLTSKYKNIK